MAAMTLLSGADAAQGGQVKAIPLASIAICSTQAYTHQCPVGGAQASARVAEKH